MVYIFLSLFKLLSFSPLNDLTTSLIRIPQENPDLARSIYMTSKTLCHHNQSICQTSLFSVFLR